jgi:hypothetical protein
MTDLIYPRLWACNPAGLMLAPESLLPKIAAFYGVTVAGPATDDDLVAGTTFYAPACHIRYLKRRIAVAIRDPEYRRLIREARNEPVKELADQKRWAVEALADSLLRVENGEPA